MIQTIEQTSTNNKLLHEAFANDVCSRYVWHEMVTCTFKEPLYSDDQAHRAVHMFYHWNDGRYFKHAEKVGDVRKVPRVKLRGGDSCATRRKRVCEDGVWGWVDVPAETTRYVGRFKNQWKRNKGIRPITVVGVERHKLGAVHLHALVHHRTYQKTIRRDAGWLDWFAGRDYGQIRIMPVKSQIQCVYYVTKYVCKSLLTGEGKGDVIFSDSFGELPRTSPTGSDVRSPLNPLDAPQASDADPFSIWDEVATRLANGPRALPGGSLPGCGGQSSVAALGPRELASRLTSN